MVLVIFFIASLNIALGCALAFYLDRRLRAPLLVIENRPPKARASAAAAAHAAATPPPVVEEVEEEQPPEDCFTLEQLPAEWLRLLEKQAIEPQSFLEASAQVLKLEVSDYRESLIGAEERLRHCREDSEAAQLFDELSVANTHWMQRQREAEEQLASQRKMSGPYNKMAESISTILAGQEQCILALSETDVDRLDRLHALLDSVHSLRDAMNQTLDVVMRCEDRLESLDKRYLFDRLTTLKSRTGLEMLLHKWRKTDGSGMRLLSVVLCDIDKFGPNNQRFGVRDADRLLAAFGAMLDELRRTLRGFERPVRYSGQSFLLFLPDTGPRNAMSAAERIRQSIEAMTFDLGRVDVELSVSCGITEVLKRDTPDSVFARLDAAVAAAKTLGGNRTTIDEGSGPTAVDPPQFRVHGKVIEVPVESTQGISA
ncbi:GGDEF domain-containing protein [Lignipirellula cremea]|uniref:diguanylate cyclase n=1 Tax=Lignipirellula cremea TaxID=2528010 RepID=A0A518DWF4_9BACT|nr:GGDEF domain-containing protein [Lignipirellula cremea]QDU96167.1 Response regulator PleD [Lignipirellula cremea]